MALRRGPRRTVAAAAAAAVAVAALQLVYNAAGAAAAYSDISVGTSYYDSLSQGYCKFYRFFAYGTSGFTVSVVASSGDPDLCLSVDTPPATVCTTNCVATSTGSGSDYLTVYPSAYYYYGGGQQFFVRVNGYSSTSYSVRVSYLAASPSNTPTPSTTPTPAISTIYMGSPISASVASSACVYYRVTLTSSSDFTVTLTPLSGDPDLTVGLSPPTIACSLSSVASSSSGGVDAVTIFSTASYFTGYGQTYYVQVHGFTSASFTLLVAVAAPSPSSTPSRTPSRTPSPSAPPSTSPTPSVSPGSLQSQVNITTLPPPVSPIVDVAQTGERRFYLIYVPVGQPFRLSVTPLDGGDPDLYVGVDRPLPGSPFYYTTQSATTGADTVTLSGSDTTTGAYYIDVVGYTAVRFSLQLTYLSPSPSPLPTSPPANPLPIIIAAAAGGFVLLSAGVGVLVYCRARRRRRAAAAAMMSSNPPPPLPPAMYVPVPPPVSVSAPTMVGHTGGTVHVGGTTIVFADGAGAPAAASKLGPDPAPVQRSPAPPPVYTGGYPGAPVPMGYTPHYMGGYNPGGGAGMMAPMPMPMPMPTPGRGMYGAGAAYPGGGMMGPGMMHGGGGGGYPGMPAGPYPSWYGAGAGAPPATWVPAKGPSPAAVATGMAMAPDPAPRAAHAAPAPRARGATASPALTAGAPATGAVNRTPAAAAAPAAATAPAALFNNGGRTTPAATAPPGAGAGDGGVNNYGEDPAPEVAGRRVAEL